MPASRASRNHAADSPSSQPNGTSLHPKPPIQLAFTLPASPDTRVHIHLTNTANSLLVFLATRAPDAQPSAAATLGGFVHALPNRTNPSQPLSTALYTRSASLDFVTRLARILAARCAKPVFVGGEVKFWEAADEGVAMRAVVDAVMAVLKDGG